MLRSRSQISAMASSSAGASSPPPKATPTGAMKSAHSSASGTRYSMSTGGVCQPGGGSPADLVAAGGEDGGEVTRVVVEHVAEEIDDPLVLGERDVLLELLVGALAEGHALVGSGAERDP